MKPRWHRFYKKGKISRLSNCVKRLYVFPTKTTGKTIFLQRLSKFYRPANCRLASELKRCSLLNNKNPRKISGVFYEEKVLLFFSVFQPREKRKGSFFFLRWICLQQLDNIRIFQSFRQRHGCISLFIRHVDVRSSFQKQTDRLRISGNTCHH